MLEEIKDIVLGKLLRVVTIPLVALVFSVTCAGPKTTQLKIGNDEQLALGNWTLDDIAVGDRYGDVVEFTGVQGTEIPGSSKASPIFKFKFGTVVHFSSEMLVVKVIGQEIEKDDEFVLSAGRTTTSAVTGILGKGHMLEEFDYVRHNILDKELNFKHAVYQYHDGKANRFKLYFDRDRTLEKIELTALQEE